MESRQTSHARSSDASCPERLVLATASRTFCSSFRNLIWKTRLLGRIIRFASITITPQVGFRITHNLGGFSESGSELALNVNGIANTCPSVLADLDICLNPRQWRGWTVVPSVTLGYELALASPQVESVGDLYGFTVDQFSANDSRHFMKLGLSLAAQHNAFAVVAGVNAVGGNGASSGINPQVSVGYRY